MGHTFSAKTNNILLPSPLHKPPRHDRFPSLKWNRIGGTENHSQAGNGMLWSRFGYEERSFMNLKTVNVHVHEHVNLHQSIYC